MGREVEGLTFSDLFEAFVLLEGGHCGGEKR